MQPYTVLASNVPHRGQMQKSTAGSLGQHSYIITGRGIKYQILHLMDLLFLRVPQINGCSYCVDEHVRDLRRAGESNERLYGLAAWRESPYFTESEGKSTRRVEFGTYSIRA